jgi:hypothetical protein
MDIRDLIVLLVAIAKECAELDLGIFGERAK